MEYKPDTRMVVYPSYINSKSTVQEGRRIPKDKAVEDPNILEMQTMAEKLLAGLRNPTLNFGRH